VRFCASCSPAGAAQSSLGGQGAAAPPTSALASPRNQPRDPAAKPPQEARRPGPPPARPPPAARPRGRRARAPAAAPRGRPNAPAAAPAPPAPARPRTPRPPRRERRAPPCRAAGAAAAGAAAGAATAAVVRPPEPEPPPPAPPKPVVGTVTGLPLPRFAALGSNQVNLRIGPDLRYRIEWTYQRRDLPVQIIEEHQIWRKIRDPEGTEGWVQRPLLNARRTFLVQGDGERTLRRRPEGESAPVAHLKPGVIGAVRRCEAGSAWCEVRVADHSGCLRRSEMWGVGADEAIE
jgi:SH3-like domain-containing protein